MGSLVLLDTSALLTLRVDEPGAERVDKPSAARALLRLFFEPNGGAPPRLEG